MIRWNEFTPQWAIDYCKKYLSHIKNDNPNATNSYIIELVRDTIYNYFRKAGKVLSQEKRDKIAWLSWCNFNYKKYCKFIDYNAKIGMLS